MGVIPEKCPKSTLEDINSKSEATEWMVCGRGVGEEDIEEKAKEQDIREEREGVRKEEEERGGRRK